MSLIDLSHGPFADEVHDHPFLIKYGSRFEKTFLFGRALLKSPPLGTPVFQTEADYRLRNIIRKGYLKSKGKVNQGI